MAEGGPTPYLRSNLARTMYNRLVTDERLRNMDLKKLYSVDELALPEEVMAKFVQLSCDAETQEFLDNCFVQSEWLFTQMWHSVAKAFLGMFMTQTSVNGLLGRGRMFVWSESQARQLLRPVGPDDGAGWMENQAGDRKWPDEQDPEWSKNEEAQRNYHPFSLDEKEEEESGERSQMGSIERQEHHDVYSPPKGEHLGYPQERFYDAPQYPDAPQQEDGASVNRNAEKMSCYRDASDGEEPVLKGGRLLDLGAGDGHVTQILAKGAEEVHVTEASPVMRKRLRDNGYRVLDTWHWVDEVADGFYDVVTCLNLLDRCDTPRALLKDIHAKLADEGALVVALVLPFSPYVEIGSADNLPSENLGVTGSTLEEQVTSLSQEVFPSLGYKLDRWARLPYLCEGDLDQAFYWLSDVVLVFKKAEATMPLAMDDYEDADNALQIASGLERVHVDL